MKLIDHQVTDLQEANEEWHRMLWIAVMNDHHDEAINIS